MKKIYLNPTLNEEIVATTDVIALSLTEGEATSTDTPLVNEHEDWGDLW